MLFLLYLSHYISGVVLLMCKSYFYGTYFHAPRISSCYVYVVLMTFTNLLLCFFSLDYFFCICYFLSKYIDFVECVFYFLRGRNILGTRWILMWNGCKLPSVLLNHIPIVYVWYINAMLSNTVTRNLMVCFCTTTNKLDRFVLLKWLS